MLSSSAPGRLALEVTILKTLDQLESLRERSKFSSLRSELLALENSSAIK